MCLGSPQPHCLPQNTPDLRSFRQHHRSIHLTSSSHLPFLKKTREARPSPKTPLLLNVSSPLHFVQCKYNCSTSQDEGHTSFTICQGKTMMTQDYRQDRLTTFPETRRPQSHKPPGPRPRSQRIPHKGRGRRDQLLRHPPGPG